MRLELAEEDGRIAPRDRAEDAAPWHSDSGQRPRCCVGTCAVADVGLVDGPAEALEEQP